MRKQVSTHLPLARQQQIITKQMPDELLVYDLERNRAHSLNESAAAIWKLCDGRTIPADISKKLEKQTGQKLPADFVWLALDQLSRDHLLAKRIELPRNLPLLGKMSRRDAVKRIGLGAAIALPVIYSITAPTPGQAATCRPSGAACVTSADCCSGFCRGNNTCR